jgi:choline kinase
LTTSRPKCLLEIRDDQSVLDFQLEALASCGIEHTTVLVGFGAEYVEHSLANPRFGEMEVTTLYNPFFAITDNLATCWIASVAMTDDFVLLNGDTVFEEVYCAGFSTRHGSRLPSPSIENPITMRTT